MYCAPTLKLRRCTYAIAKHRVICHVERGRGPKRCCGIVALFGREVGNREKLPHVRVVLTKAKRALAFESIDTWMAISPQPNPDLARLAKRVAYGSKLQLSNLVLNFRSSAREAAFLLNPTTGFNREARPARLASRR